MKTMIGIASFLLIAAPALAQDKPTVEGLLKQGYEVVGVFPSNAGPGLVLENDDDKVMICFVAETSQSTDITTQYCKPVK